MRHVTIIGGGIAGLATAFYLQKRRQEFGLSLDYALLESNPYFGGKIITETVDDFIIEGGPDSFLTQKPEGLQLCRDLGLTDRLLPTNDDRRNVFVLSKGKLVPFPGGFRLTVPTEFVPFALSPLISPWGKVRMGLDLLTPARQEQTDESVASFFRRRLGQEAVDKIAGPMMAGIYMADPERLSIQSTFPMFVALEKKYGSLIKGMRAAKKRRPPTNGQSGKAPAMFTSLRGGMQELSTCLVQQLQGDLRTNCQVSDIRYLNPGFEIIFAQSNLTPLRTDAVILAVPAYIAARLLTSTAPELATKLEQIRYVSTATVSLGYRRADVVDQHDFNGFGFMIPRSEGQQIAACTWSSTKFNDRASDEDVLLRVFIGGDGRGHLAEQPDEALLKLAKTTVAELMGLTADPLLSRVFRWPNGSPQYDVGHLGRVSEIETLVDKVPGLHLTGSAYRGIGIPDCIKQAVSLVDRLSGQLL